MKKHHRHFDLLCNVGELSDLLTESSDIRSFLQRTAAVVARYLTADVCSIYLYDEEEGSLVLRSTVGLNPRAVDRISMRPDEGLVGATFERQKPILEACASQSPRFKRFEEADEDPFESFLAVPISRGVQRIGVLVVQHQDRNRFTHLDILALKAAASQLAGAVENARLLIDSGSAFGEESPPSSKETPPARTAFPTFIRGRSASDGYAYGRAVVFHGSHTALLRDPSLSGIPYSLNDFHRAVKASEEQLKTFQARFSQRLPESATLIFSAHFMILKDNKFMNRIIEGIEAGTPVPEAIKAVANQYIEIFSTSTHTYIREKTNDIEDLTGRILRNLYSGATGGDEAPQGVIEGAIEEAIEGALEETVVIAGDLHPSEVLRFACDEVEGIVLVRGGVTSHVAILARSLQIPLVIANRPELMKLPPGTPMLLDADIGNIYIRPADEVVEDFQSQRRLKAAASPLSHIMSPETRTADRVRIRLLANINLLAQLSTAKALKAEGVGLYRTEFPFLIRPVFPSETEQYLIYKRVIDEMEGREVTIRTLDIGGDKALAYGDATAGPNPALGLRSIRFSLRHRELFEIQIRAILRAGADAGILKIMFPMISSVDEFLEAKAIVHECMASLERDNLPHQKNPAIGMMVELPAVIEIVDRFVQEADFLSVGTNDFIQYMLGVDRTDEKVADYYRSYHPSILRGLNRIVKAAAAADKEISICGEMAHEPETLPFLIGIGLRRLSIEPKHLPLVQARISSFTLKEAEEHARSLLEKSTIKEIRKILDSSPFG